MTLHSTFTRLLAPLAVVWALTLVGAASPAAALVTPVAKPQFGVEPHSVAPAKEPKLPLAYHGGPVMHSTALYAIYWDPTGHVSWNYDGDWRALIDEYLQAVGQNSGQLDSVFAAAAQYDDSTNAHVSYASTFRGAYTDTDPYPTAGNCVDPAPEPERTVCLTDAQLRAELGAFMAAHGLRGGLGTIFFIMTPPGVTVCTDAGGALTGHCSDSTKKNPWAPEAALPSGEEVAERESYERSFCSYHAWSGSPSAPNIYAVLPWTAGDLAMYLPAGEVLGTRSGSDCQDGSGLQEEPNQPPPPGLDMDGDYDSALADVVVNELSVEQLATETDPLLNGWYAPTGQANAGNEVTDQCRNFFATANMTGEAKVPEKSLTDSGTLANQSWAGHSYYLNNEFNQAALSADYPGVPCVPGVHLTPRFTAPSSVNAGDIVGFDAAESDVTLNAGVGYTSTGSPYETFPTYTWDFGDGTKTSTAYPPGASQADEPSAFHSYQYGGTYEVTLTITDVGGNTASISRQVTVIGPPRPAPPASSSVAGSPTPTSSSSASTTSSSSVKQAAKGMPAPAIHGIIGSHSLAKALGEGLAIRYTVNEQVAGNVEVLLAGVTAKRLGIHSHLAHDLPKGYARSVVVGTAVLVTTKGGHGELRVKFPKAIAEHLAHAHKLELTLRIRVRNAARHRPQTTTLMSVVELKG